MHPRMEDAETGGRRTFTSRWCSAFAKETRYLQKIQGSTFSVTRLRLRSCRGSRPRQVSWTAAILRRASADQQRRPEETGQAALGSADSGQTSRTASSQLVAHAVKTAGLGTTQRHEGHTIRPDGWSRSAGTKALPLRSNRGRLAQLETTRTQSWLCRKPVLCP